MPTIKALFLAAEVITECQDNFNKVYLLCMNQTTQVCLSTLTCAVLVKQVTTCRPQSASQYATSARHVPNKFRASRSQKEGKIGVSKELGVCQS